MNLSIQILHSITLSMQRITTIRKPRKILPQSGRAIAVPFEINHTTSFAQSAGFHELAILKTNRWSMRCSKERKHARFLAVRSMDCPVYAIRCRRRGRIRGVFSMFVRCPLGFEMIPKQSVTIFSGRIRALFVHDRWFTIRWMCRFVEILSCSDCGHFVRILWSSYSQLLLLLILLWSRWFVFWILQF